MNAHVWGAMPHIWADHLDVTVQLAREAMIEMAASDPKSDDIIMPVWDMEIGRCLYTQKLSGDAYLDYLALQGEEVPPGAYENPPDRPE